MPAAAKRRARAATPKRRAELSVDGHGIGAVPVFPAAALNDDNVLLRVETKTGKALIDPKVPPKGEGRDEGGGGV